MPPNDNNPLNFTQSTSKMKYRADIDGIRAIAVLMVLFYHAHFPIIVSGFIGVDIFFVISGFLITNILLNELSRSAHAGVPSIRFINFYKKRLWRLMPVLIAMLIVTTIVTALCYLPSDFISFTRSAKNVTLFNSNVYFARTTGGYFSDNINYLTLLHTWSLAVEWQWYAILPILLYGMYRIFTPKWLPFSMVFLTCLFIGFSLYLSRTMPDKNYYTLLARIFELLLGSVVAILPLQVFYEKCINQSDVRKKVSRIVLTFMGIIGLSVLAYVATQKNVLIGFPNYYALAVCGATAFLILTGQLDPDNLISKGLACRPLVFIGLLSYSLYIWHWPIFATIRYLSVTETLFVSILCLGAAFLIGFISWYSLERPARRFNQANTWLTFALLVLLPILLTQGLNMSAKASKGFPMRFGEKMTHLTNQIAAYNQQGRDQCINRPELDFAPICRLGATQPDSDALDNKPNRTAIKTAYLIGDSFANHLWGFMDVLGRDADIAIQSNTMPGCLALPKIYLVDLNTPELLNTRCHDQVKQYYERIQKQHYDYVILGQRWSGYIDDRVVYQLGDTSNPINSLSRLKAALNEAIEIIIQSGAQPVIFEETFIDPINGDNICFFLPMKRHIFPSQKLVSCVSPLTQNTEQKTAKAVLMAAKEKYPELILIDPKVVQCPDNKCVAEINGVPIFRDLTHINDFASYQFGTLYLRNKVNPFKQTKPQE